MLMLLLLLLCGAQDREDGGALLKRLEQLLADAEARDADKAE
jgi:hypothetical protein